MPMGAPTYSYGKFIDFFEFYADMYCDSCLKGMKSQIKKI